MSKTRAIFALILTYMLFAMLLNSVGTVILQSIHTFGASKPQASVLEACKDLSIAVVACSLASMLPRLGYRRALIAGLTAVAVACAAMPLARSFGMTELLFVIVGMSFGLAKVAVYSSIGLLAKDPRGHASLTSFIEGMFMVGVVSSGWVFSAFVRSGAQADTTWLNVYWVFAVLAGVAAALWAVTPLDERESRAAGGVGLMAEYVEMLQLMRRPLVAVFLASAFLYVLVEQSIGTWLPTFNNEILHLPTALSIQMTTLFAGSLAAGRLSASALLRRVDWFTVVSGCVVGMGVLVLVTLPGARAAHPAAAGANWAHAPLAAYALPLIGLLMSPIYPTINSVMLSALPKTRHASMTGLIVIFSALGGVFGSLLTGLAFSRFGGVTAFYGSLLPMTLLLASLGLLRRWSRETIAIPAEVVVVPV